MRIHETQTRDGVVLPGSAMAGKAHGFSRVSGGKARQPGLTRKTKRAPRGCREGETSRCLLVNTFLWNPIRWHVIWRLPKYSRFGVAVSTMSVIGPNSGLLRAWRLRNTPDACRNLNKLKGAGTTAHGLVRLAQRHDIRGKPLAQVLRTRVPPLLGKQWLMTPGGRVAGSGSP